MTEATQTVLKLLGAGAVDEPSPVVQLVVTEYHREGQRDRELEQHGEVDWRWSRMVESFVKAAFRLRGVPLPFIVPMREMSLAAEIAREGIAGWN